MKKLYLIRHAKASWDNAELPDFDRPLTPVGEGDAQTMGGLLREQKIKPDYIISSSAERAIKTAQIIAEELQFPISKIVTDVHIYSGGVEELINLIKSFDKKHKTILFVGHNPALTWLSHYLCEGLKTNIATCGILGIEFDMSAWDELSATEGQFLTYLHPHHEHPEHESTHPPE